MYMTSKGWRDSFIFFHFLLCAAKRKGKYTETVANRLLYEISFARYVIPDKLVLSFGLLYNGSKVVRSPNLLAAAISFLGSPV